MAGSSSPVLSTGSRSPSGSSSTCTSGSGSRACATCGAERASCSTLADIDAANKPAPSITPRLRAASSRSFSASASWRSFRSRSRLARRPRSSSRLAWSSSRLLRSSSRFLRSCSSCSARSDRSSETSRSTRVFRVEICVWLAWRPCCKPRLRPSSCLCARSRWKMCWMTLLCAVVLRTRRLALSVGVLLVAAMVLTSLSYPVMLERPKDMLDWRL
mmetsp:Transcript_15908/g.50930  ORF Transcript_15908/g.50930 Transcript_15908/m.50930 type:complete len:216 (-) Transcript_15908:79-726(-)